MLKMVSGSPRYMPIVNLAGLTSLQADKFCDACENWLRSNSDVFFDKMELLDNGDLLTNTPLTETQLAKFSKDMAEELARIVAEESEII